MDEFQKLLENTGDIAIYRLVPEIVSVRNSQAPVSWHRNRFYFWGAIQAIAGYSRKDFLSGAARWKDIVYPSDYPRLIRSRKALFSTGKSSFEVEYRIRHKHGGMHWVREIACKIYDASGSRVHLQGLIRDITVEKKRATGVKRASKSAKAKPAGKRKTSGKVLSLSPGELAVAERVKCGESTKDIARSLKLSVRTVESYRDKIRTKMGLKNRKVNLKTYLLSNRAEKILGGKDTIS